MTHSAIIQTIVAVWHWVAWLVVAFSKMMGHTSIQTTQIYAKITGHKIGEDMKKLAGRIKGKYTINNLPTDA